MTPREQHKSLALIIGRDTPARAALAHEMLEHGYAIVMCSGPPGCALAHDDTCALVHSADVAIFLSPWHEAHGGFYVQECAAGARCSVFAWPPPFPMPPGSVVVRSNDPAKIAATADTLVRQAVG